MKTTPLSHQLTAEEAAHATGIIFAVCGADPEGNAILVGEIRSGRWIITGDSAIDEREARERLGNYQP